MKTKPIKHIWTDVAPRIILGLAVILVMGCGFLQSLSGTQNNSPSAQAGSTATWIEIPTLTAAPPTDNGDDSKIPTITVVPPVATPTYGEENPTSDHPRATIDLNAYCSKQYGSGAYAVAADMKDAYSWSCYQGNQYVGVIDMNQACAWEYPALPKAIMGNRQDALSWYCSNANN